MNQKLDKKLCEKYPKMFKNRNAPMSETCMCWGFECGDGWYKIIEAVCEAMTHTYSTSVEIDEEDGKRLGVKPSSWTGEKDRYFLDVNPPQAIADQVKEKFGTLRFYYHLEFDQTLTELSRTEKYPRLKEVLDRYSNYFDGIVHMAETLSGMTCEDTGTPGEIHVSGGRATGWLKTLNVDYASSDPFLVDRGYVPYSTIKKKDV
jgi:hypothetical protein